MWTRKELKQRAKEALKRNYWKIVLVAALSMLLNGGLSYSSSSATNSIDSVVANTEESSGTEDSEEHMNSLPEDEITYEEADEAVARAIFVVVFIILFLVIALVVFAVVFAFIELLYNPFYVGVARFMLKSVDDRAEVREIAYGFDHSYKNIVKTMFRRDIQVFLWALLFVIPGVYKKYQYRMVPYILAEHPDMDHKEALDMSKEMMNGEKWHTFVLDLSFILWHMLGMITCGMAELFYVGPYVELTNAALYRRLCCRETEIQY